MFTSTAMIFLVWSSGHWEFERIAYYSGPDSRSVCERAAPVEVVTYARRGMTVRVFCQPNDEEKV